MGKTTERQPSPMKSDNILPNNPGFQGMAAAIADIPYTCEGQTQFLTLVTPAWDRNAGQEPRFPFIVFLQGSAWTSPNRYAQLPQLCRYAQQGIAIASITHRDATLGNPFPAYLKDAKAAIRFLRGQAAFFGLDPERVGFFGTSSGGNTALLVGLTGDDPRYRTEDYASQSDAVQAVADCFGPADLLSIQNENGRGSDEIMSIMTALIAGQNVGEVLRAMSPIFEVREGISYPPFLLVHGDADPMVPYEQSARMHERLREVGARSWLVCVANAEHEGSFWSEALHKLIFEHFKTHL
jgi:acetyl esterase/lipase